MNNNRHKNIGSEWGHKNPPFMVVSLQQQLSKQLQKQLLLYGIAMVTHMAVDTLAPTVGVDACVDCSCEDDCDDCDDAEVPLLVGRAISFKVLPLLKCIHRKSLLKTVIIFQKYFHKNT